MSPGLTRAGALALVRSLLYDQAVVQLFEHGEPVGEPVPYDVDANTGIVASREMWEVEVSVRRLDGHAAFWWPIRSVVHPGDTVSPPDPAEWFTADERVWFS